MKLTWYGHACFKLETADGSVVFDPYQPGDVPGLTLPPLSADAVICSHGHSDHNAAEAVTLSGKAPTYALTQIPCFHDEEGGKLRGTNLISIIESEGLRVVHMGDIGHPLSEEQFKALGQVDVMMIPVGGFFTVTGTQAAEIVKKSGAKAVIPMHFRGADFGYEVIGPVDEFLSQFPSCTFTGSASLELTPETEGVIVLNFRKQ